jgi:hypothetical protein
MTSVAREAAKLHREFGWNVLPVGRNKRATCGWGQWQENRQTRDEVNHLFRRACAGLAVIPGIVSRGLCIRDFDQRDAYAAGANAYPRLALELPTAQTGRGAHVYFRSRQPIYVDYGDGELRGDGGHNCVAPPLLHPSGVTYQWLTPPVPGRGGNLLLLDPAASGLRQQWIGRTKSCTGAAKERHTPSSMTVCGTFPLDIEIAIQRSLPTRAGQRNAGLFVFGRLLRSIPDYSNASADAMESFVIRWHERALPVIRTKPYRESWSDFRRGWEVAWPMTGISAVDVSLAQAVQQEPPAAAAYSHPHLRLLVGICYYLQRFAGEEPFFLSTRDAARLLGIEGAEPQKTSWRYLRRLERDGVLRVVERGTPGQIVNGRAASYRFMASNDHTQP